MITRALLKTIKSDAEEVLASVAKKHGVKISFGSGSFTPDNATLKMEIASFGDDGQAKTKEARDFERNAEVLYGLKPEDLGAIFTLNGREWRLVGAKPRSPKYPFLAECTKSGKVFKLPLNGVARAINGAPKSQTGLTKNIKEGFQRVACNLSPENLCCDGELPMAQVRKRRAALNREWKALEQRVGRTVSEDEIWSWT